MEVGGVHHLHHQRLLLADRGELLAELRGGDEARLQARAALARDGIDHPPVRQLGTPSAEHHAVQLPVMRLGRVLGGRDVPGDRG